MRQTLKVLFATLAIVTALAACESTVTPTAPRAAVPASPRATCNGGPYIGSGNGVCIPVDSTANRTVPR